MSEVRFTLFGELIKYRPECFKQGRLPWRPYWVGSFQRVEGDCLATWKTFAHEFAATVSLLPEVALLPRQYIVQPIVHTVCDEAGALKSVAVLGATRYRVPIMPGIGITLRGRRLIDEAITGEDNQETADAFVDSAAGILLNNECDCVCIEDVESPSHLRKAMSDASRRYPVICIEPGPLVPHRYIRFPGDAARYWSRFSKKTRYNFRWRAKHLEHSVICVQKQSDVPMFVDRVCALMSQTWQHKRLGVTYVPDIKLELWNEIAKWGAMRSYLLMQGDRTIAFVIGYQWKGRYKYQETGYDSAFAYRSPGQVLLYRVIEDLIARDTPSLFDFGYGENEYKRIYANHQTITGPMLLVRKSIRPVFALRMGQVRNLTGRLIRTGLKQVGVLSAIRHIHRGRGA